MGAAGRADSGLVRIPIVALACLALVGCAGSAPEPTRSPVPSAPASSRTATAPAPPTTSPSTTPTPPQQLCLGAAATLSVKAQVGQLIMVGVNGPLTASERTLIAAHQLGSVVLLGDQPGSVDELAATTATIAGLAPVPVLTAADQEGGLVQRLAGRGFSTIPNATQQAKLSDAALRDAAKKWGSELAAAGVRWNLAPVADVVPPAKQKTNRPIGALHRGYGSSPSVVTGKTQAVIDGLDEAGVAASVKHFPGLGEVVGNTDFARGIVDAVTTADSPSLAPFRSAAQAGVASVMISSARYSQIDPANQAVFSAKVIGLVRDWGFHGVVISDDLGAAASVASVPAGQRAVRFVAAGGDVVIDADPSLVPAMTKALLAKAAKEPAFAARVTESAARVLALKQGLGTFRCG